MQITRNYKISHYLKTSTNGQSVDVMRLLSMNLQSQLKTPKVKTVSEATKEVIQEIPTPSNQVKCTITKSVTGQLHLQLQEKKVGQLIQHHQRHQNHLDITKLKQNYTKSNMRSMPRK